MALEFTYRITSTIPWSEVADDPDTEESRSAGQRLGDEGNHVVSLPIDIDDYTKEWTLTFPSVEAWQEYEAVVINGTSEEKMNTGFTVSVVSMPSW